MNENKKTDKEKAENKEQDEGTFMAAKIGGGPPPPPEIKCVHCEGSMLLKDKKRGLWKCQNEACGYTETR
jgi:hypothetical protein